MENLYRFIAGVVIILFPMIFLAIENKWKKRWAEVAFEVFAYIGVLASYFVFVHPFE